MSPKSRYERKTERGEQKSDHSPHARKERPTSMIDITNHSMFINQNRQKNKGIFFNAPALQTDARNCITLLIRIVPFEVSSFIFYPKDTFLPTFIQFFS